MSNHLTFKIVIIFLLLLFCFVIIIGGINFVNFEDCCGYFSDYMLNFLILV